MSVTYTTTGSPFLSFKPQEASAPAAHLGGGPESGLAEKALPCAEHPTDRLEHEMAPKSKSVLC